ncbi:MAG: hypothetical protein QOF78_3532 [Phycisphaerales bacterium]|nr:hypothetical protein [Phycisphaerales bacterium]
MVSNRSLVIALLAVFATTTSLRADTIWAGGGAGGTGLEVGGVQIKSIQDGKLVFITGAGRESTREVRQVSRVAADGELSLNAAEEALASGKFDVATEGFRKALSSSAKDWVKTWSAQRLTSVAPRANRFDAAASGYIALLVRDPVRAADYKPAPPPAGSTFVTSAINEANAALATPSLAAGSKEALQKFLDELQQAGTEVPAAAAASNRPAPAAAQAGAPVQTVAAAASDAAASAANQQVARQKLAAANAALERKDFPAAITEIRSNAKIFLEPRDQAQALYFIAEAQTGIATAKNDVPSWQDAALAYLRVVAHFRDGPPAAGPFAARSMLKAAQINERLQDPAAADARAAAERLKPKP